MTEERIRSSAAEYAAFLDGKDLASRNLALAEEMAGQLTIFDFMRVDNCAEVTA